MYSDHVIAVGSEKQDMESDFNLVALVRFHSASDHRAIKLSL